MPQKRRLLVIDDLRDAAESLAKILAFIGHEVEYVTEPKKAMDTARRIRPELVFLDLGMPEIDGYELARMLRAEFGFEGLRLVALTAWGRDEDRVATRRAGFDAHVTKPADPAVIESTLETLFGSAQKR
jgi:DNA-binding response OmpR family regulator